MSSLEGARVAVVGEVRAGGLARSGASLVVLDASEFWTAREPSYDLVVLGRMPGDLAAILLAELRRDPRLRRVPRLAVVDAETARRLVRTGPIAVVDADASEEAIAAAADEVLGPRDGGKDDRIAALEAELRAAASALEEQARGRAVLAHDVRVLLAVIVGYGANLRDGFVGPLDATQRESVERMVSAANDASALLERYSASARRGDEAPPRPSAPPRRAVRRAQVDVTALVAETAALFADSARDAGVTLDVRRGEPIVAWCDAVQLKQCVVNLVVNALKLTPRGGRVEVVTQRSSSSSSPQGQKARSGIEIVVSDSGPGVPEPDRERIFERGVRLERDATVAGRGIGLSVVREVTVAHGGTVHVETGHLGGAAFVVRIPTDLRRRQARLLVVRDADAADLLAQVEAGRDAPPEAIVASDPRFVSAAAACDAIVVTPSSPELDDLLERLRGPYPRSP